MIKNTFEIDDITITTEAKCFCPLGKDWYTNHFDIRLEPGEFIPDYCDVDKWIDENIDGTEKIVEEAVSMLFEHIKTTYKPLELTVDSYVDDARHSDVSISKRSHKY